MKEIFKQLLEKIDILRLLTALTVMGIFFMVTNALINREIPPGNREIVIHLLGIVEGAVMTIVGYEFGSSKGSQKKDQTINETVSTIAKENA